MSKILMLLALLFTAAACAETEWEVRTVINCNEWVSLRAEASTAAERLAQIPLGAEVEAHPFDESFAECRYQGMQGYVLNEFLGFETGSAAATGELLPNVADFLSLRSAANASSSTLMQIQPGTPMELLGWSGKFAKVRVGGREGYVNTGYVMASGGDLSRWPYDYSSMLHDVEALGDNVECEIIGASLDGREIPVLRFGSGDAHILIQAGIHGREVMSGRLAMDLLMQLTEAHPGGVEGVTFHVIPMANPDGVTIAVHGPQALNDPALASGVADMLRRENSTAERWKANARGVDLNRNFDAGWETLTGRTPGSVQYRGEYAHSEPESIALAEYTKKYDFAATVSYHSFGSILYWQGAPDAALNARAESLANLFRARTGYPLERSESTAVERGGYKDWALEDCGIPSITVEIGAEDSTGSAEEYTAILLRHQGSWEALADWVRAQ